MAATRGSDGGADSSTSEIRRQCAPVHLRYGSPPNPPSSCCPDSRAVTLGPSRIDSPSSPLASPRTSRRVSARIAGSSEPSSHSTAYEVSRSVAMRLILTEPGPTRPICSRASFRISPRDNQKGSAMLGLARIRTRTLIGLDIAAFGILAALLLTSVAANADADRVSGDPQSAGPVFVLDEGGFSAFDAPGVSANELIDINRHGQIAGTYVAENGVSHGFLRDERGRFARFDFPGASVTYV